MTFWRMLRAGMKVPWAMAQFRPTSRQRLMQVLGTMDSERSHLMRRPYWYLLVVGVDPAFQARGIGGRLIAPVLHRADEQGLPCYLETETESNVAFYQRRGFVVVAEKDVPGYHFHIWLMLREAGRSA
jgi:ribosomal protein S18 acetylase RimI-like enzyme